MISSLTPCPICDKKSARTPHGLAMHLIMTHNSEFYSRWHCPGCQLMVGSSQAMQEHLEAVDLAEHFGAARLLFTFNPE